MSLPRIIKKYPNRRLYDTEISRYITLADIRRLVVEGIEFRIIDKQSQADITTTILLQVISEQENTDSPMLSREFLLAIISNQGDTLHAVARQFLDQSMILFSAQLRELRKRFDHNAGNNNELMDLADHSLSQFKTLQKEVFSRFYSVGTNPDNHKSGHENG